MNIINVPKNGFHIIHNVKNRVTIEKEYDGSSFVARIEIKQGISNEKRDQIIEIFKMKIDLVIENYKNEYTYVEINKDGILLSKKREGINLLEKDEMISWKDYQQKINDILKSKFEGFAFKNIEAQEKIVNLKENNIMKLANFFAESYTPEGKNYLVKNVIPFLNQKNIFDYSHQRKNFKSWKGMFIERMRDTDFSYSDKLLYLIRFKILIENARKNLSPLELISANRLIDSHLKDLVNSAKPDDIKWAFVKCQSEIIEFCNSHNNSKETLKFLKKLQVYVPNEFSCILSAIDNSIALPYLKKRKGSLFKTPLLFPSNKFWNYVADLENTNPKKFNKLINRINQIDPSEDKTKFLIGIFANIESENLKWKLFQKMKLEEKILNSQVCNESELVDVLNFLNSFVEPKLIEFQERLIDESIKKNPAFIKNLSPDLAEKMLPQIYDIIVNKPFDDDFASRAEQLIEYAKYFPNRYLTVQFLEMYMSDNKEIGSFESKTLFLLDIIKKIDNQILKWSIFQQMNLNELVDLLRCDECLMIDFIKFIYNLNEPGFKEYRENIAKQCIETHPSFIKQLPKEIAEKMIPLIFEVIISKPFAPENDPELVQIFNHAQYFPTDKLAIDYLNTFVAPEIVMEKIDLLPLRLVSLYLKMNPSCFKEIKAQKSIVKYLNAQNHQTLFAEGKNFPRYMALNLLPQLSGETKRYFEEAISQAIKQNKQTKSAIKKSSNYSSKIGKDLLLLREINDGSVQETKKLKDEISKYEKILFQNKPLPKDWQNRLQKSIAPKINPLNDEQTIQLILSLSNTRRDTKLKGNYSPWGIAYRLISNYRRLFEINKKIA